MTEVFRFQDGPVDPSLIQAGTHALPISPQWLAEDLCFHHSSLVSTGYTPLTFCCFRRAQRGPSLCLQDVKILAELGEGQLEQIVGVVLRFLSTADSTVLVGDAPLL
jgi:hypothetical protein